MCLFRTGAQNPASPSWGERRDFSQRRPSYFLHLIDPEREVLRKLIDVVHKPQGQVLEARQRATVSPAGPVARAVFPSAGAAPQWLPRAGQGLRLGGGRSPGAHHLGGYKPHASGPPTRAHRTRTSGRDTRGAVDTSLGPCTRPWGDAPPPSQQRPLDWNQVKGPSPQMFWLCPLSFQQCFSRLPSPLLITSSFPLSLVPSPFLQTSKRTGSWPQCPGHVWSQP